MVLTRGKNIKVFTYLTILAIMAVFIIAEAEETDSLLKRLAVLRNFDEIIKKEHFLDPVEPAKPEAHILNCVGGIQAKTKYELELEHFKETQAQRNDPGSFIEGDMKISKNGNFKREVFEMRKWPVIPDDKNGQIGVIPYTIHPTVTNHQNKNLLLAIEEAISDFAKFTCVRFQPRKDEADYLEFIFDASAGCYSDVGKTGGQQHLSISDDCAYKGTLIHEMMHTVGFFHEHTRPDRDKYITINYDNIKGIYRNNFQKYDHNIATHYNAPYDYYSIMHYNQKAFSREFGITITPKDPNINGDDLGQRKCFTETDVKQINEAYCPKSEVSKNEDKIIIDTNSDSGPKENKTSENNSNESTTEDTVTVDNTEEQEQKQTEQQEQQKKIEQQEQQKKIEQQEQQKKIEQQEQQKKIDQEEQQKKIDQEEQQKQIDQQEQQKQSGQTGCENCQNQEQSPCQQNPCWPCGAVWSTNGYPSICGCKQETTNSTNDRKRCKTCRCLNVNSEGQQKAWTDNYLCYKSSCKLAPNFELIKEGDTEGKRCLQFDESDDWKKLNLCYNKSMPYKLYWSQSNQLNEKGDSKCLMINEPSDWAWKKKYLCM